MISKTAEKELREAARSDAFRTQMDTVTTSHHNPFIKNGVVDTEAYILFVTEFNAFINHEPRRFDPILANDMRL